MAWMWAGYITNREDVVPLATLIGGAVGIYLLAIQTPQTDNLE